MSRTSVYNYLDRPQRAGLSWPLPENLERRVRPSGGSIDDLIADGDKVVLRGTLWQ